MFVEERSRHGLHGDDVAFFVEARKRRLQTAQFDVEGGLQVGLCGHQSVVDAIGHNLRPIIVEDCVGDRAEGPHQANLFDMQQKYADLMSSDDAIAALGGVSDIAAAG